MEIEAASLGLDVEIFLRNGKKVWEDGAVGARGCAAVRVHLHGNRFV